MIKLKPLGAAGGEVTGSAYLLETDEAKILIDCGLFQGGHDAEAKNRVPLTPAVADLDAVVLTHGHLDHTGRLPLLTKAGYAGPVHATSATIDLTGLILRDSAKIQAQDAERINRKRERAGEGPYEPLYTLGQVETLLQHLSPVAYHKPVPVAPGVTAEFVEAGHMLGSASILVRVQQKGMEKKLVFSGDLGPKDAPILRDSEPFPDADVVVLESTYGDHDHRGFRETVEEFFAIVKASVASGGKILVPTFAVGRAQLLTMLMAYAFRRGIVSPFPVYLDSPMALEAWKIYHAHHELFDDDMVKFLKEGSLQQDLKTFHASPTADDSKKINDVTGACLVLAGAGMCNAGRILHHLKQNLWRPGTHVVIVGYQAYGTLGRMLVDGVSEVKIFGEKIAVRAQVHTLGGFSAHAGQTDLLAWFGKMATHKPKVLLTHGENAPRLALARVIKTQFGISCTLPEIGQEIAFD